MKTSPILFSLLLTACATTGPLPPAVSEWIPFDHSEGDIKFDVTINGVPAKAGFDSGGTGSLIDPAFVAAHGIGVASRGREVFDGSRSKRLDTADEFTVSFKGAKGLEGVPVREALIVDRPLGVDVLLGLQFFRRLVLQIDYPNSRFRYMTPSASTIAEQANIKAKEEEFFGRLLVEVETTGQRQWVILDTGNAGSVHLTRRAAQEGGWLRNSKHTDQLVTRATVVRDADTELWVLDRLKLGPFELEDVPLTVENQVDARKSRNRSGPRLGTRLQLAEETEPGTLGHDILRHFVVTIDLDRQLLHLYAP